MSKIEKDEEERREERIKITFDECCKWKRRDNENKVREEKRKGE